MPAGLENSMEIRLIRYQMLLPNMMVNAIDPALENGKVVLNCRS